MDSIATDVVGIGYMFMCCLGGVDYNNIWDMVYKCVGIVYIHSIGHDVSTREFVGIFVYPTQLLYFL